MSSTCIAKLFYLATVASYSPSVCVTYKKHFPVTDHCVRGDACLRAEGSFVNAQPELVSLWWSKVKLSLCTPLRHIGGVKV